MTADRIVPDVGIHAGVPFPEYREWSAINFHTLWRLREECPAKALYEMENGSGETEALAFGSLTDFILLEPGRFEAEAVVEPEIGDGKAPKRPTDRQRNAKKPSPESVEAIRFWDTWDTANAGKIIAKRTDYDKVLQIERQVRTVQCREYICGGRSQVCVVWRDKKTGLLCKARLDYERTAGWNHIITDLKTSRSAHPDYWQWSIYKYGYFMQLSWYELGWSEITGDSSLCGWLIAEKDMFCGVVHTEAHEDAMLAGRKENRRMLDRWGECVEKNDWPFYEGGIINLSPWALRQCGVGPDIIEPPVIVPVPYRIEADTFEEAYQLEML